jgi:hypothetical protein
MRTSGGYWSVTERIGTVGTPAEGLPGPGPDARSGTPRVVTEPDHGGVQVQDQLASLADRGPAITQRLANRGRHRSAQMHSRANPKAELEKPDGRDRQFAPDAGRSSRIARQRVLRMHSDGCLSSRSTVRVIELREGALVGRRPRSRTACRQSGRGPSAGVRPEAIVRVGASGRS